uniref:THAP-type domain-containing protein n=1 Tax=Schizaphis graminum TaxID=13262 RepID=A0A2S2P283_SCHGA
MPRKCVICNAYDKNSEQSFYSFPKDEGRKKLWLKACGIDLYLPSYKVCEAHFSTEDFLPSGLLKNIVIPRKNYVKPEPLASTNTVFESSHQETQSSDKVISTNSICNTPKKRSSDQLPDVSSSQKRKIYNPHTIGNLSPSHFDTPKKAKRNLEMIKCKFDQKKTQNSNLKKQVKRLQAKLKTYDDLILQLKHKNSISENTPVHLQVKLIL